MSYENIARSMFVVVYATIVLFATIIGGFFGDALNGALIGSFVGLVIVVPAAIMQLDENISDALEARFSREDAI